MRDAWRAFPVGKPVDLASPTPADTDYTAPPDQCRRLVDFKGAIAWEFEARDICITLANLCSEAASGYSPERRIEDQGFFASVLHPEDRRGMLRTCASLTAEGKGRALECRVTDDGIGIDTSRHDAVFRMFTRLNPRAEYPGNGIGAVLCGAIVEREGGRIRVEAAEPTGVRACFTPANDGEGS